MKNFPKSKNSYAKKSLKSQVFSLDFIIALTMFILILGFFFWAWNSIEVKKTEARENTELSIMALQIADSLSSKQGFPQYWDTVSSSEISSLGLLTGTEISAHKITALVAMNYSDLKQKLGVLGPRYEVGIEINSFNGTAYTSNATIGLLPNINFTKSEKNQRLIAYGNYWSELNVYVSKSKN